MKKRLFKKKSTYAASPEPRRTAQEGRAPVFSYHSRRSTESTERQRTSVTEARPALSKNAKATKRHIPTIIAIALIGLGLLYASTLTKPQVKINLTTDAAFSHDKSEYEAGINKIFSQNLLSRSKILIDTHAIENKIKAQFPEVSRVVIGIPIASRRPIITVEPAEAVFVLQGNGGTFVLDSTGKAIGTTADFPDAFSKLLIIEDQTGLAVEKGAKALSKQDVEFLTTFVQQLRLGGEEVRSLRLPAAANEVHFVLNTAPYYIKANMAGSAKQQAGTYFAAKQKFTSGASPAKEYVDVRVDERLYYK